MKHRPGMKLKDLIDRLTLEFAKHGNLEVRTTWEGIIQNIEDKCIYVGLDYPDAYDSDPESEDLILYIDADNCDYKDRLQK